MRSAWRTAALLLVLIPASTGAWAQWSSNPAQNLPLSNIPGADQVQPKLLPLSDSSWYVSWFNNNPNDPPPHGYDVYYQYLSAQGVEQLPHDGQQVAKLTLSSTEDYGMAVDSSGNILLAFLDDRHNPNPQVTVTKLNRTGHTIWGPNGIALTNDPGSHHDPKVTVTSDGFIVVGWTNGSSIQLQKLTTSGLTLWIGQTALGRGKLIQESGFNYTLSDLHAGDNGSVIVSWVRAQGFSSPKYLYANKLDHNGNLLWGANHVHVFDGGSLQFGEFPYFIPDGSGGGVFSWYSSSPSLQVYAQHILANGTEAFPHNGSVGSTNTQRVRVSPSVSYNPTTQETFFFWTEQNSLQSMAGVWGQKFNSAGTRQWSDTGLVLVPLGNDSQNWVENVQIGTGALVFWADSPGFGSGTIQATKLDGNGSTVCTQFPVSTTSADKSRLVASIAPSGLAALAWEDDRNGENDIYIQNVNADCTLGQGTLMGRR
jgi:hypothetical protein